MTRLIHRSGLLLRLALVLAFFVSPAIAQSPKSGKQDCTLKIYVKNDITVMPDGRIAMSLGINGQPTLLMVDTGAVFGVVTDSLAQRLGLRQEPIPEGMRFQFYNRVRMRHLVTVDAVSIGGATMSGWQFLVAPAFMFPRPVEGLIGANVLKAFDVDIDIAHNRLNLISQDHCPGQVVYWTRDPYAVVPVKLDRGWYITIPVTLDGKTLTAVVDTGAAKSFMTLEEAHDLFGVANDRSMLKPAGTTTMSDGTRARVYRYPFTTMTFEGVMVRNPAIVLVPERGVASGAPQLLLGMSVLRQLHVYIAYREKALYLTAAGAK